MYFLRQEYDEENQAEKYIRDFFIYNHSDEFMTFHNIVINEMTIGLVILESKGVIIVEIKPYSISQIKKVTKEGVIQFYHGRSESPINQAVQKRNVFLEKIRERNINLDNRAVAVSVAYPFIDNKEFINSGLIKTSDRNVTFLKDDFLSLNSFVTQKDKLFEFVYKVQNITTDEVTISNDVRDEIGSLLYDDYLIEKSKDKKPDMLETNLKVNSKKDLFYGICMFLMKNDITTGNIYSQSKEILDGLGNYMSSISIPWQYDIPVEDGIGYCFKEGEAPQWDNDASISIETESKNRIVVKAGVGRGYCIDVKDDVSSIEEMQDIDTDVPMHLKNEQIRQMFLRTFVIAQKEIDIISPWMNFGVVNEKFEELMNAALSRGVTIKIIYGLKPDTSDFNISRSRRSDEVAKHLRRRFAEYGKQLVIKRDNIHYKLVLCDEKFKLEGGYNYLSFIGDYTNKDTRKEGSPYGTNVEEIRLLRKDYFEDVN